MKALDSQEMLPSRERERADHSGSLSQRVRNKPFDQYVFWSQQVVILLFPDMDLDLRKCAALLNHHPRYRPCVTEQCHPCLTDRDMGARHRARAHSIQVMKVQEIAANKCRRPAIKQFHVSRSRLVFPAG